jgi:major membrane immunogen (membrane-anchored lipoprotein)
MKVVSVMICALMMSLMVATASFATDKESAAMDTTTYKAVPKEVHEKKFPEGHPTVETQGGKLGTHCYYDEKESLYFCSDAGWK